MLCDREGKLLWLADDTGGYEILQPGGGYNGRTREPGEPDWWVVAKDPKWQPPGMMLAAAPEDRAPDNGAQTGGASGWGSTTEPSPCKLAGADSEAGRREPPAEPWTLFSAGQEHLDHIDSKGFGKAVETIGTGIGEAVSKGAEGAGEALGKTWDALNSEEMKKGVEFGGKAALEVSKDVGKQLLTDVGLNTWDVVGEKAAERYGLSRTASILGNQAITLPLTKAVGMKLMVDDVFNGGAESGTKDLGRRIDSVYKQVYGKER